MPSKTFLRLEKEKQTKILDACIKEFSEYLFEDASINRMIKAADISRGSFYTYFESKEDVYFFLLDQYFHKIMDILEYYVKETGDFLYAFEKLYIEIIHLYQTSPLQKFVYNVFCNMKYMQEFQFHKNPEEQDQNIKELLSYVDLKKYRGTKEDIFEAFKFSFIITMTSIAVKIKEEKDVFDKRMNLLKYGIYKEEKK